MSPDELAAAQSSLGAAGASATSSYPELSAESGVAGGAPEPTTPEVGSWHFDDCSSQSRRLSDSSPQHADALRNRGTRCVQGAQGFGVEFTRNTHIVQALAPAFDRELTLSAWIHPDSTRHGVVVAKRSRRGSAFELSLERGNIIFKVALGGRAMSMRSRAPISAGRWSHVAGVYDGRHAFLFVDGQQEGQVAARGALRDSAGVFRIGSGYRGVIDEVLVSRSALKPFEVSALSCLPRTPSVVVTPVSSGPVNPGTSASYDVAVTNESRGSCGTFFEVIGELPPEQISALFDPDFSQIPPAETAHFALTVSSTTEAEPGAHRIGFSVFGDREGSVRGEVEYVLNAPSGCFVRASRESMIRDPGVVDDPLRTTFNPGSSDPRAGVWSFGKLMEQAAPTPEAAPDMVEALFSSWLSDQNVNGFQVPGRPAIQSLVLDPWPRINGKLDLAHAPLRLLAIVNRTDLRNLAKGHAGEGRFVFGVLDRDGFSQLFTLILEYRLPAASEADVLDWAQRWHALAALPFPGEEYNAALQELTQRFAARGAEPGRPNDSALGQLRTNEIVLGGPWELREFELSAETGVLMPSTVKLTPDNALNGDPRLARFVNENETLILEERHVVPELFDDAPFLAGASVNDFIHWTAADITNNDARHKLALNTCNGCHGPETGTDFLMVSPREPGSPATLAGFLTGITVNDPVGGEPRTFNDLQRRVTDLERLVCSAGESRAGRGVAARASFIAQGIGRVH
jgi:hypothetical protein